jgi:hypothetical protein
MSNELFDKSALTELREYTQKKNEIAQFHLKERLVDAISHTSIHGIYDIYKVKDKFLRLFLVVCFLGSAAFCCYLTINTFVAYFSYDVLTTSSVISDTPVECNFISF